METAFFVWDGIVSFARIHKTVISSDNEKSYALNLLR